MKPGRELDKAVAEAMGWEASETEMYGNQQTLWYTKSGNRAWYGGDFRPSVDIKAAMVAFEWLEQNSPWGQVALSRSEGQPCVLQLLPPATKTFPHSWGIEEVARGESYPHAICLAVLASREVNNEPKRTDT
jgi:hypothetical protein